MSVAVVTVSATELEALIRRACTDAVVEASRKAAATIDRVSAAEAARIAGKRRSLILAALNSRALPSQREGKNWSVRVGDIDAWASSGFPTLPKQGTK